MLPDELRADCARCCALCCVVSPFDATQGFGYDKPAQTPCRHLRADFRCGIHEALHAQGFAACAAFDCFGAGQYVTQTLFGGAHWRDNAERAAAMFAVYPRMRAVHEALALLTMGLPHARDADAHARIRARLDAVDALRTQVAQGDATVDPTRFARDTAVWLRTQCSPTGMSARHSE